MTCGIYKIINTETGKFYIGSAQNIEKRWKRHINDLSKNKHHNIYLQRAWDKYGKSIFKLEIINTCYKKTLMKREQKLLDKLFDSELLYNISPTASGGDNLSTHPNREGIINKITKSSRDRIANMNKEKRIEIYAKYGEDNPNYGNKWSEKSKKRASKRMKKLFENPEERKRMSEITKKRFEDPVQRKKMSEFAKTRIGNRNSFYGKKHTKETKKLISEKQKGRYNGTQNIPIEVNGVTYSSAGVAGKKLNLCSNTIRWRVRSTNPKFKNYSYRN